MDNLDQQRRVPFGIAIAVLAILTVAVFRLPEAFVAQLERSARLIGSQADWAFRLLLAVAVGQAAYAAFMVLRVDRVRSSIAADERLRRKARPALMASISRNAAAIPLLTLVYAIAFLWLTGRRAGVWAFVLIAVLQVGWYYRQTGEIGRWLMLEPEPPPERKAPWSRRDEDYCPPIARGLSDVPSPAP